MDLIEYSNNNLKSKYSIFTIILYFILIKYDKAVALNEYLENIGIGVRSFGNAPRLENCLRISMGTRPENDAVYKAIKDFVESQN